MRHIIQNKHFLFDSPIDNNWKYYIKRILLLFFDLIYKSIILLRGRKSRNCKYNLVACAIFKNEAPFLREWIEHNHLVGVEHFYLYNNFSTDNYMAVLQPYISRGLVSLIDWPVEQGQFAAYENFLHNYKDDTQWVTFIDLDEFYCPITELDIKYWLKKYTHYPSVVVYWRMFTTSGRINHDFNLLVSEQYTMAVAKRLSIGKAFLNTDWDFYEIKDVHLFWAKSNILGRKIAIPPVNEFKKFIRWDIHRVNFRGQFKLELNHYFSKAYNELVYRKIQRGDAVFANRKHDERINTLLYYEHQQQKPVYFIFRFIIQLKLLINNNNDNNIQ